MTNSSIDDIFSRLIDQVDQVGQTPTVGPHAATEVEASGSSYDDRITVRLRSGRVTAVEVHPAALRLDNVTLGEELATAMNVALEAYSAAMLEAVREHGELGALSEELRGVQRDAMRSLTAYNEQMLEMLRRVKPA